MVNAVSNIVGNEANSRPSGRVVTKINRAVGGNSPSAVADDLSRQVYCILGLPIDAIDMPAVLGRIESAAQGHEPFVLSTPNLNFLVNIQQDSEFRESLLVSDLCPADGMPIVWIARLMGVPINRRIAGSDIFEALKFRAHSEWPLRVFLFGATESVAAAAERALNINPGALTCVGWTCPGFGSIDELSANHFIDKINASSAHFLVAALGAKKGQLWLQRNHNRLRIPIRSHLGATINFQAGTVKRAPLALQKLGLEWLWRIKEEPHLGGRYWNDGLALLRLLVTRVLPLVIEARILQSRNKRAGHDLVIDKTEDGHSVTVNLAGFAVAGNAETAVSSFRKAIAAKKKVVLNLSQTRAIDARFFGLILMLRKQLKSQGSDLILAGISGRIERTFRLSGLEYLLPCGKIT
jgi:N-acetylglucosaminyldiphosphoundecaprenol N-acetyl-beta-D-mannosaminyltransferase